MISLSDKHRQLGTDLGLLFLRLSTGAFMALGHGLPKLQKWGELSEHFPDPLGVGSAASLALAIFAELFCSVLLMVGVATRAVAVPLIFTMLIAAFVIHSDDPWSKKELALAYALPFVTLMLTGPGRFSFDAWWSGRASEAHPR